MKKIALIATGIIGLGVGFIIGALGTKKHFEKKAEEVINNELQSLREHYNKKEETINKEKEVMEKVVTDIKDMRAQELRERYADKDLEDSEMRKSIHKDRTPEDIMVDHIDTGEKPQFEFLSEEEFEYDETDRFDKIELTVYDNGEGYDAMGRLYGLEDLGDMVDGLANDEEPRYVRDWENEIDFKLVYKEGEVE